MRASSNSGNIAEHAGERAKEYVDMGVDAYKQASDKARVLTRQVDGYVRDNPWTIIGVAAGIGLLLGLLMRRKG